MALELAAARIQALTAEQLAQRLDQRFRLLTGGSRTSLPRQQTLEATLDWSYDLLRTSERRMFERLAVFAGSWTLEAAEVIAVGSSVPHDAAFDLLASLIRKSLVQAEEAAYGAQRYALLETVRDYGRQKLLARGIAEATATRQRHAVYYSKLAERLCSATRVGSVFAEGRPAAVELRDRIDGVYGNLRIALRWWLEASQPIEGLRLAVTLCDFWMWCGRYHQARRWLERMLDLANHMPTSAGAGVDATSSVPVDIRTRALINLGVLGLWQGKYALSCAVLQTAVALADQLGDTIECLRTRRSRHVVVVSGGLGAELVSAGRVSSRQSRVGQPGQDLSCLPSSRDHRAVAGAVRADT